MWFALVPYCYFIKTRLNKPAQQISWFLVYFIPVLIFSFYHGFNILLPVCLAYYIVNLVYENGYIQNDIVTSRKEKNPTRRVDEIESELLYKNIGSIFCFRFLLLFLLLVLLFFLTEKVYFNIFLFLAFLLQILFFSYNLFRNRVNFYLILPLSYLRFYAPILPFLLVDSNYSEVIALFFVYPFAKFLEFSKESKFNFIYLPRFVGLIDFFRVKYYFIVLLFLVYMYFYTSCDVVFSISVVVYYFFYRLVSYLIYSNSSKFKSLVDSGAKKEFRN